MSVICHIPRELYQLTVQKSQISSLLRWCSIMSNKYYELKPIKLGCEIRGIDLKTENRPEVIDQIKKDVIKHRILVFKDQGMIEGKRHVEISRWFGELDSVFHQHPKSPAYDVFRVSNDPAEGCTGVGRTGWHIDGTFQRAPYSYSLYHMVSVPRNGATVFAPLTEIINALPESKYKEWDRLWMSSDRRSGPIHPLIYKHPITKEKVMCFHLGMTNDYIYDYDSPQQRVATPEEFARISREIHNEFEKDNGKMQYKHDTTEDSTHMVSHSSEHSSTNYEGDL